MALYLWQYPYWRLDGGQFFFVAKKKKQTPDVCMLTVSVSIYHLAPESANGFLSRWSSLGGMYHVGIEFAGVEWSYGYCERGSGVFAVAPTECSLGPLKESITLGNVDISVDKVIRILHRMRRDWMGPDYSLLSKNCITFSKELLVRLSPSLKLPSYVTAMVDLGTSISSSSKSNSKEVDIFGSPEKELMWTTAEKLMREYERGEVPSTILPPIIHSEHAWFVASRAPSQTYKVCMHKLYNVRDRNFNGYMQNMLTRQYLLRSSNSS